ncbi:fasciclin domain-containing protein [Paraglaciecola aquimarina]|uniref:Fasciclin domain-containing protein n=1 Tax=Paraglaciecola algarum TaxID=3050085 RepID=A0ABS9DAE1_9ALTE|nr:fasciclin domain-containing protein [Paraglaciecola sp. G1-23]MCF2949795.1 fasciclin domain-containing protein [Paraglaciecola sp. G1-23]
MRYLKIVSITLVSLFFLQACSDDDVEVVEEMPAPTTIVDVAVANGNFTTLVAALEATGLVATLSDTNAKFTVFAPTDEAFALLGQDTINALLADTDTLTDILTYHVIGSEVDAATAIGLAGTTVEVVNGDMIGLSLDGDNLLVNTSTVTMTDIQTDNGIIHVIDAVLLPPADAVTPSANIVETAVANGSFTTLVAALQVTGLDTVLADENATFTVFAPTDDAFALIGDETINTLLNNTDMLSDILLQHVVVDSAVDSVTAYSLNGAMVETASMATIPLQINTTSDMLTFGGANVIIKDIHTTNGIIHVIDAVIVADVTIPAPPMSLVDVAAANGSFTTLVSALQSTGLDSTLANLSNDYTVFAPSDEAFEKLAEGTLDSLTTEQLSNILLYHVLPGKVMADAAITLAQSDDNKVTTANNDMLALSYVDSTLFVNGATVSTADVMADNGIIHVIDNVIMPPAMMGTPTQNIVEVALADPDNFSTLVDALITADLVSTLADEDKMFTVFAPTNAAFAAVDPDALNALLADVDALTNTLLSHVVADASLSSLDAYAANGKSLTTASGAMVDVSVDAQTGMLMIGGSNVVIKDIYTTNGVIHVIDAVILGE